MSTSTEPKLNLEWLRRSTLAALTLRQAAQILGVDQRTMSKAVRDGTIPHIRIGKRVVIPRLPLLTMLGAEPSNSADPFSDSRSATG